MLFASSRNSDHPVRDLFCKTIGDELRKINDATNAIIKTFPDGRRVFYLDINATFLQPDGTLTKEIMPDLLHPQEKGYRMWAEAMEPMVKKLMGE